MRRFPRSFGESAISWLIGVAAGGFVFPLCFGERPSLVSIVSGASGATLAIVRIAILELRAGGRR